MYIILGGKHEHIPRLLFQRWSLCGVFPTPLNGVCNNVKCVLFGVSSELWGHSGGNAGIWRICSLKLIPELVLRNVSHSLYQSFCLLLRLPGTYRNVHNSSKQSIPEDHKEDVAAFVWGSRQSSQVMLLEVKVTESLQPPDSLCGGGHGEEQQGAENDKESSLKTAGLTNSVFMDWAEGISSGVWALVGPEVSALPLIHHVNTNQSIKSHETVSIHHFYLNENMASWRGISAEKTFTCQLVVNLFKE